MIQTEVTTTLGGTLGGPLLTGGSLPNRAGPETRKA